MAAADANLAHLTAEGLIARLERVLPASADGTPAAAARAIEFYGEALAARGARADPYELWCAIETDRWFGVPAIRLAERQSDHQPDTYVYLFTWRSPALEGRLGACHALDVPFVFGTTSHPVLRPFAGGGPAADALAETMQDAWLAFARVGNPNVPGCAEWPRYDPERRATMILGEQCHIAEAPLAGQHRFWQELALR
jgi:para-nitrobenzyl esterase